MARFKDALNREWAFTVNVAGVKLVRTELQVDLCDLGPDGVSRLFDDQVLTSEVIALLCGNPAGIHEGLVGDGYERALDCLLDALSEFFPRHKRESLAALRAAVAQLFRDQSKQLAAELAGITADSK